MGKYLRIRNRGECPRVLLQYFGVSQKRERMHDDKLGGWFGSDTNFCPLAALRLGIEVWISSRDDQGSYLVTYRSKEVSAAGKFSGWVPPASWRFLCHSTSRSGSSRP